jgi:Flp pilus assembly protein TadG
MTRARRDAGQVTTFVVFLAVALIMCAGLVVDGGRVFAATRDARNAAAGAARAGAQALNVSTFRQSDMTVLDQTGAEAQANAFLASAGYTGTVIVNADSVIVTITTRVPMVILNVVGVAPRTVTVTETARTVRGP